MTPQDANPIPAGWQRRALIAAGIGVLALIIGFFTDATQTMRSYLFAYVFWTGIGTGSLGILLLHYTVGGKWGLIIRRICEGGAGTLPFMAVLLIPILIAIPSLYPWAAASAAADENLQSKSGYLNVPFFIVRSVVYFAIFALYTRLLTTYSRRQDETGDAVYMSKLRTVSAPGLVVFTVVATFAFVDWIMSLEPHWFSTVYGAMFLIGEVLSAFAVSIALVLMFRDRPPFRDRIHPQHVHDLGNLMFAFTVLWAYLSFSQFLIIWSGNLPEEISWYLHRLNGAWSVIAVILVVFHFCIPFVVLLQRDIKRRPALLLRVCAYMLAIRIVDVYWVVEPAFYTSGFHIQWTDFAAFVALGGAWIALFLRQLRTLPLLPLRDPGLATPPKEMVTF